MAGMTGQAKVTYGGPAGQSRLEGVGGKGVKRRWGRAGQGDGGVAGEKLGMSVQRHPHPLHSKTQKNALWKKKRYMGSTSAIVSQVKI